MFNNNDSLQHLKKTLQDIDAIFTKALEDCYCQDGNKLELRNALLDLSSNYGQVSH